MRKITRELHNAYARYTWERSHEHYHTFLIDKCSVFCGTEQELLDYATSKNLKIESHVNSRTKKQEYTIDDCGVLQHVEHQVEIDVCGEYTHIMIIVH